MGGMIPAVLVAMLSITLAGCLGMPGKKSKSKSKRLAQYLFSQEDGDSDGGGRVRGSQSNECIQTRCNRDGSDFYVTFDHLCDQDGAIQKVLRYREAGADWSMSNYFDVRSEPCAVRVEDGRRYEFQLKYSPVTVSGSVFVTVNEGDCVQSTSATRICGQSGSIGGSPPLPAGVGCIDGKLLDPKSYFFALIGRREGDPARDWYSVMMNSTLPKGPREGEKADPNVHFGITQQINSSGEARGRIFLPTDSPSEYNYYIRDVDVLSGDCVALDDSCRWAWYERGGAAYAPQRCQ